MSLAKKIILTFSIMALLLCGIFGTIYYRTVSRNYIDMEYRNLQAAADNYTRLFRSVVTQMDDEAGDLLADYDVLSGVKMLSTMAYGQKEDNFRYIQAERVIENTLNTDYVRENFYRIVLFMQNGVVLSGTENNAGAVAPDKDIFSMDWVKGMEENRGKSVLLAAHSDQWAIGEGEQVISLVRQVLGHNLGYIEIQKSCKELDEIFMPVNKNWSLYALCGKEIVYSCNSISKAEDGKVLQKIVNHGFKTEKRDGDNLLVAFGEEQESEIRIAIVSHVSIFKDSIANALPLTIGIVFSLGTFFVIITCWISFKITKPLRQVTAIMEKTEIDTLTVHPQIQISDREIQKLYRSYTNVLERLHQSIQKEKNLLQLKKQAQFDLLQAQVNPHFLYNVLNVISARGAEAEDDEICEICSNLAQMLRYSTNVKEKYASVEEEIHYMELYLKLLKYRYEDGLEYKVQADNRIYGFEIPKMVLQQLVENSILHGYCNVRRKRELLVSGIYLENGWSISIRDNGTGIPDEKKMELYEGFRSIKAAITSGSESVEMEIGGMGMVNTYARLFEIYQDNMTMEILQHETGTEVMIKIDDWKKQNGE